MYILHYSGKIKIIMLLNFHALEPYQVGTSIPFLQVKTLSLWQIK